jgi:hypothetical protein
MVSEALYCHIEGVAVWSAAEFFIGDSLMAMSMMKEAWLERFGGSETLENTPAVIAELDKRALDGMPIGSYVWSELEKQCEQDEYFVGTRGTEIVSGIHRDAARFYLREKPFEGFWMLVPGEIHGPRNRNFYLCDDCGHRWIDEYPGIPDDDCDVCGNRTAKLGWRKSWMEKAIWWGLKSIAAPTRDPLRGAIGHTVSDEKVRQFDNELDGARQSEAYWAGVLSALKDRATGIDRTRQTRSWH